MMLADENHELRGELRQDEPMSAHCSWRAGGPVRTFYRPADLQDLSNFLPTLPDDEPVLWLGLGSNLLVRDGGFDGTVISTQGRLGEIDPVSGLCLEVEAGATCAKVAREAARSGLHGGAFFAGIPGTMGGALAMNAGAFGGETWARVNWVRTIDRTGTVRQRRPEEYQVAYREVSGPLDEWFVGCQLQFKLGDVGEEQGRIRELLDTRGASQPTGLPSGGSTFRNPEGDHAARLIEAAGLKGLEVGDAVVSEKHANFIINRGNASATDIEQLIELVQAKVAGHSGVRLQREVHIVGEHA